MSQGLFWMEDGWKNHWTHWKYGTFIRENFYNSREFICCDQFSDWHGYFLDNLSKIIGARFQNPGDNQASLSRQGSE
jgi:hypothetical protein